MEEPVFMHSSSVLRKKSPEWVVYQEVFETTKLYMRGVTAIEPEWLPVYAPALCNLSPPLVDPPPRYDEVTEKIFCHVTGTFGNYVSVWSSKYLRLLSKRNSHAETSTTAAFMK
jgi:ATP-dependent RNA helicase DHX37/DHR1